MAIVHSDFARINIPENINCTDWLLERSKDCLHRTAMVNSDTKEEYSYGDLKRLVNFTCHLLRSSYGLVRGQVICIFAPNTPETGIIILVMFKLGITITSVNPLYTPDELRRQLYDSGATYIYTHLDLLPKVRLTNISFQRIIVRESASGCISLRSILNEGKRNHMMYEEENAIDGRSTTALLPYSSGTTGLPKGVQLTHYNIIANVMQLSHPGQSLLRREGETVVGFAPFFHVSGVVVNLLYLLATRGTLVVMPTFEYHRFLQLVMEYKATSLILVPPVLLRMVKDSNLHINYDLSSVKSVLVGSAPTSPEVLKAIAEKLNINEVSQGWGMSETTCVGSFSPPGSKLKPASVGKVVPNTKAKIVDVESGATLGLMEKGELCIRGPQIMSGYWNNPKQTAETIDEDGWLHTGDVGYIDKENYIFIVDRLKELIKVKGFQVAPAEIEAVLLTCPGIVDAAVVGVAHPECGEVPRAYVVLREGEQLTDTQIQRYVEDRVARYKRLQGGVNIVKHIPKSPSGKILRRLLNSNMETSLSKL